MASDANVAVLEGHTASVIAVRSLGDGRIASGSADDTIRIWDPARRRGDECTAVLDTSNSVFSLCALGGDRLASGGLDQVVRIWDLNRRPDEACIAVLEGHRGAVSDMCRLRDGRLATVSHDNGLRIWDVTRAPAEACTAVLEGATDGFWSVSELSDGRLATGEKHYTGTVRVWDLTRNAGGACIRVFKTSDPTMQLVVALPSGHLASETDRGVRIWDPDQSGAGACVAEVDIGGYFGSMCVLSDGCLATMTADDPSEIRLWDLSRLGRRSWRRPSFPYDTVFRGEYIPVRSMCELPGGRLASSDDDGAVCVFSI